MAEIKDFRHLFPDAKAINIENTVYLTLPELVAFDAAASSNLPSDAVQPACAGCAADVTSDLCVTLTNNLGCASNHIVFVENSEEGVAAYMAARIIR